MENKTSSSEVNEDVEQLKLEPGHELRFEVENGQMTQVELISGLAELFGTELTKGKKYYFYAGAKVGIFTWHGCILERTGKGEVEYIAKETPMNFYINIHGCLENMRKKASEDDTRGPFLLICGPKDYGKTTLSRILLNYAVRRGRSPAFIDLDVGQSSIGIPGTLGVNIIERPAEVEGTFSTAAPLILHFGYTTPEANVNLYNTLINKLSEMLTVKMQQDKNCKYSGGIINTCGWIEEDGYKSILHAASSFEVDVVLVIDKEKLYNEIVRDMPQSVKIVFTPKSGGVVDQSKKFRKEARDAQIRRYFYGSTCKILGTTQFYPHSFDISFVHLKLYKIGAPSIPDSCLPIGMKLDDNYTKLVPLSPDQNLLHHILSVSFLTSPTNAIETNVQGFVVVTNVDMERKTITVLSPQPRPLPIGCILLYSDVTYMDTT